MKTPPSTKLVYTIAGSSEHSKDFVAENVLYDHPFDHLSRWTATHQQPIASRWLLLKLQHLSVLTRITFGKYYKQHACNMKEFKVFVGTQPDSLKEALHAGLKNDNVPETFELRHTKDMGVAFLVQYVKIVPISAHTQSFHTSIWYVALFGISDAAYVKKVQHVQDEYLEHLTLSHILAHLRRRRLLTPYRSILERSGYNLEHPLVTQLYSALVLKGDFIQATRLFEDMAARGLFEQYLRSMEIRAEWTRVTPSPSPSPSTPTAPDDILCSPDEQPPPSYPSPRGGHAMCIDTATSQIYLLGGYDGTHELSDFWVYSIPDNRWALLSADTEKEKNGPGRRCCHKIVWDEKSGCIYLLGRLGSDVEMPGNANSGESNGVGSSSAAPVAGADETDDIRHQVELLMGGAATPTQKAFAYCSEFHRYHTRGLDAGKWDLLSFDTASAGGPSLIFDHQMVMDSQDQMLYVFGGRVVDGDRDETRYSGLYSYNVKTSKWKRLQTAESNGGSGVHIPSRFGHSMILDPPTRTLYIFAGQRDDKYLSDMYAYDLRTALATQLYADFTASGGPDASFTQRAVGDPSEREIYVFCGLTKALPHHPVTVLRADAPNWVYRYDTQPGKWAEIRSGRSESSAGGGVVEPQPRYASQIVYHPGKKMVFMHGGNAGLVGSSAAGDGDAEGDAAAEGGDAAVNADALKEKEKRLDDLWCMLLRRSSLEEILRRATYRIRRQQFVELATRGSHIQALGFLRNEVSSMVDHNDIKESLEFRGLVEHLLPPGSGCLEAVPVVHQTKVAVDLTVEDSPGWTNKLGEESDELVNDFSREPSLSKLLCAAEDPEEWDDTAMPKSQSVTGPLYTQRMDVFESLLDFVGDKYRQPRKGLMELIDGAYWRNTAM